MRLDLVSRSSRLEAPSGKERRIVLSYLQYLWFFKRN